MKHVNDANNIHLIGQIVIGMKALPKNGINHRDLKPTNMLPEVHDEEPNGIFGAISYIGWFKCSSLVVSQVFWRSHEVLQPLKMWKCERLYAVYYTPKFDAYNFGMTCWEILTDKKTA